MKKLKIFLHHLMVPNELNNYKSKALHLDFLSFYLIGALILLVGVKNIHYRFPNILGFATDITANKLLELTNVERSKINLGTLKLNQSLSQAAENKAKDMFSKNYWSHFGPNGETPWDFILGSGYQYEFAGENLAKNFLFSQGVVDAWMRSPTHKENLLRKEYTDVGYAVVNGVLNGEETTLVVQMFGTPTSSPVNTATNKTLSVSKVSAVEKIPVSSDMQNVLGNKEKKSFINLYNVSIDATYFFLFFFIFVLAVDFVVASKLHIIRISGKNLAHLVFVSFILLAFIFILKKGTIL